MDFSDDVVLLLGDEGPVAILRVLVVADEDIKEGQKVGDDLLLAQRVH